VGQIELTRVQNGPVGFEKEKSYQNTTYLLHNDNFVSRGLQKTNKQIGKSVILKHRDLLKKIPRLGIFCTQSVKQGLNIRATGIIFIHRLHQGRTNPA
jgi:hypothetical protein